MTTAADIAEIYIAAWNETDVAARRAMIADTWTGDAVYVDPMAAVEGHAGVDALIAGVQERFPGFRFALIGEPDGHGEHVRFSWGLGPDGAADAPIKRGRAAEDRHRLPGPAPRLSCGPRVTQLWATCGQAFACRNPAYDE